MTDDTRFHLSLAAGIAFSIASFFAWLYAPGLLKAIVIAVIAFWVLWIRIHYPFGPFGPRIDWRRKFRERDSKLAVILISSFALFLILIVAIGAAR